MHAQAYGESVGAAALIPLMLDAFMDGRRLGFRGEANMPRPRSL
jgi:hypothetical protein